MRPDPVPLSRAQRLALAAASFLLLATAAMALGPLIAGSGWWWLCAFVAGGVLFSGAGLRALRTPASLVPVLELVVLLLLLTLVFGGASSIVFLIPTQGTFETFDALLSGAQRTIEQQSVPAIPVPPLLFALALGIGLIAVFTDVFVQTMRMPALAAAPALVPILVPGFIIEAGAEVPALLLTAAAYLLLLRVDVRVRRRARLVAGGEGDDAATIVPPKRVPIVSTLGASLGLAAVGLLTASVLAASTPSVSTSLLLGSPSQGTLFARGVSPFIDLGRDLRRPDALPAFHYFARNADRPYFTLLTLDRFEGEVWGVTDTAVDGDNTVDAMPLPMGLSEEVSTAEHPIEVVVDEVRTTWLPVPYPTSRIEGLSGSWFWDAGSLAVRSVDTNTGGQRYLVTRLEVDPTVAQLRDAGDEVPAALAPNLALPDEMPPIIAETAASVTAGTTTKYDAAVAIQSFLRSALFDYSTEAPVEAGYDGGGFDVIAKFLETKSGYCVHFASTMAVLARELGIPSRISLGYTQGSPTQERVDGVQRVEVDSHDLHSWPELYFEGVGWVPFEPTPGRGSVPDYSRPGAGDGTGAGAPSTAPALPGASGRPELDPDRGLAGQAGGGASVDSWWQRGLPIALVAVLVLLLPALLRLGQRAARRRRVVKGERPADAAWDEVIATARDLGAGGDDVETARAFAATTAERAAFGDPSALAALIALRDAVERERYGPEPGVGVGLGAGAEAAELQANVARVRAALLDDAAPMERVRAALAPRSLFDLARRAFSPRPSVGA
ncbi:transglutaminase family protein [Agromyces sp. NPDC055520]